VKKEVSVLIYSLDSGGAERVVSNLLYELKKFYKIKLILMNNKIFYKIPNDVEIIFLENSNPRENGIKKFLKLPFLAYKYSKIKSDISISFLTRPNYINIMSQLFKNSKTIISERSLISEEFKSKNLHSRISKCLIKNLYKYSDIVVSLSKGTTYDLKYNYNVKNVTTIYNLVDIKTINSLLKEKINFNKNKFVFITVGRLVKGKRQDILIKSIIDINAELWIIGDGEEREQLEELVDELKIKNKVKFFGKQTNPFKFLSKADCFVFASNHESFGNVLVEALACELPIISTDCKSGPREILAPNTEYKELKDIEIAEYGVLTPVGDVEKMSEAMKMIYEDKTLREKLKSKAKKRANDFSVEKIIKQWRETIEK